MQSDSFIASVRQLLERPHRVGYMEGERHSEYLVARFANPNVHQLPLSGKWARDGHSTGLGQAFSPWVLCFLRQHHCPSLFSLDLFYYVNKGRRCGCDGWEDNEGQELMPKGRRTVLQELQAHFYRLQERDRAEECNILDILLLCTI